MILTTWKLIRENDKHVKDVMCWSHRVYILMLTYFQSTDRCTMKDIAIISANQTKWPQRFALAPVMYSYQFYVDANNSTQENHQKPLAWSKVVFTNHSFDKLKEWRGKGIRNYKFFPIKSTCQTNSLTWPHHFSPNAK